MLQVSEPIRKQVIDILFFPELVVDLFEQDLLGPECLLLQDVISLSIQGLNLQSALIANNEVLVFMLSLYFSFSFLFFEEELHFSNVVFCC